MHYPFQDRFNLYIRDHATDKDVFELVEYIDTATIRIVGCLVRFYSGWHFEAEIPLTPEHVRIVAEFVAHLGRPSVENFPRRNCVDFSVLPARSHDFTLKAAEKEDGCFVSVGGLVTDIEELEAQREGLPVWLL